MNMIIFILITVIILFQSFYISSVLANVLFNKKKEILSGNPNKKLSIIIPIFNAQKTIDQCLNSILCNDLNLIDKVFLVLDHCTDDSINIIKSFENKFERKNIKFQTINLTKKGSGKVFAIKHAINFVTNEDVLLLDSDIIIKKDAIQKIFSHHLRYKNLYTSCLVYPFEEPKRGFINGIVCQDHLYRQNILKKVREKYGIANFPGSIGIVKCKEYKKYLSDGFLEDLSASFRILNSGESIFIFPQVLAREIERHTLRGILYQRARWTIGNMENIPLLLKTFFIESSIIKKILIFSYPLMWYIQHYVIVFGLIMFFMDKKILFILPFLLYFIQILISSYIGRADYNSKINEIFGHCIIFPFIISTAFIFAIILIIINKKMYFKKEFLFRRI